jgi:peptidoglycan/LPS O-acetylase OafA/YrhL
VAPAAEPLGHVPALDGLRGVAVAEVFNWHLIAAGDSYGSSVAAPSPLQHFWSLAVEQQFYVLLPLVPVAGLGAARRGEPSRRTSLVVVVVLLAALVVAVDGPQLEPVVCPGDPCPTGTSTTGAPLAGWRSGWPRR